MLHGFKVFQVKRLTFGQSKDIFCYRIVQTVSFAAHALVYSFGFEHLLVLLVLVLSPLIGGGGSVRPIGDRLKRLREHFRHQPQYRSITQGVANQITVMQVQNG